MANVVARLGNLEIAEMGGQQVYRCCKCGYVLCPHTENYKLFALKNEAPISKGQPDYLASGTDKFVLREYYCPQCALMFQVDIAAKEEEQIWSPQLKKL